MPCHKEAAHVLHRYGSVAEALALRLLTMGEGDRLEPVRQLAATFGTGRGTIQAALKLLVDEGAVMLESQGKRGSFIRQVNQAKLLAIAGISPITGVMPVAYSRRFQGLATGLTRAFEQAGLPLVLAMLRGGRSRIHFLRTGRCDFAVISRLAWESETEKQDLRLALSFGPGSNVGEHVLLLARPDTGGIVDGMRVGIDPSSHDHVRLTMAECQGKTVQLVEISYAQVITKLVSGEIDAAVWDTGVPVPEGLPLTVVPRRQREPLGDLDTEAVLITRAEPGFLADLLARRIDPALVTAVQRQVLAGEVLPGF
jgi:hypothetical protein